MISRNTNDSIQCTGQLITVDKLTKSNNSNPINKINTLILLTSLKFYKLKQGVNN